MSPIKGIKYQTAWTSSTLELLIYFKSSSYDVKEQYLIYDENSMFADIGGYMGLLLGDRYVNENKS